GFETRPIRDLEPAFGHEHHAAPAADIGDRAFVADEPLAVFHRRVDKGQCRLGLWPKLRNDFRVRRLKARRMAHLGDCGDVIGFPGQPFARLPTLLLGRALEMAGLAREVIEDDVRLQDRQTAMPQGRHDAPAVDRQVFRLLLPAVFQIDRAERERQPRQCEIQHRLVAGARGEAAVKGDPFHRRTFASYSFSSIASALETPYSPEGSTWSAVTTPLSATIE